MCGRLFVISAPSGAGKSSLVNAVLPKLQENYSISRVVTYTSRSPRAGEINGHDYHFITEQHFAELIENDFFIEWNHYAGHYYGSSKDIYEGMEKGHSYIMIIDKTGASALKSKVAHALYTWITVPSISILEQRLVARGTEDQEKIKQRLLIAEQEMHEQKNDSFFNTVIINDSFDIAVEHLVSFIKRHLK